MQYGCSVRCACELAQVQRATFHYQQRGASKDELLSELTALAQHYPGYGYRRAWAVLRRTRNTKHYWQDESANKPSSIKPSMPNAPVWKERSHKVFEPPKCGAHARAGKPRHTYNI